MITYKLYISESDNVDTVANAEANGTLKDQGVDVTSLSADNLDFNTQYYYNVIAEDSVGKSIYESNSVTTIEAESAPTEQPTITEVIEGVDQATVDFTEVARAASYQFRINAGNSSIITEIPFTILNLQPNTSYNVEVRAVNSGGNGPWSDPFSFTTQQVSAPTGTPTLTEDSHNLTSITASYTTISDVNGYEYRLNGSIVVDIELDNPFTISGLAQNSTNTIEVRGYNNGGDGPWSNLITVTTDSEVTDQPTINSVENTEDPVSISFTGVDFASGYDYRINSGVAIDIGTTNPFTLVLDEGLEYTLEIRGKNEYGNGPWSAVTTFTTDYTNPTISDSSVGLSVNDTNQTYTVNWTKATDNVTATADLEYFLVETNVDETTTITEVLEMTPKATGVDVNQFTIQSFEDFSSTVFIYVKDEAGNTSFYQAVDVFVSGPEVSDVEIYDQDPSVFTSEVPISSFQNSGSLDLSSEQGSVRLYADVAAFNGADDTVTWSTSDASKVSITVIDDYTVDINYVSSEAGDVITITATSDFDSFFKASVDINLYADTSVANTESTTFELQT